MARSHVIDGVTYVEVDRYAKEGDKIISKLTEYIFDVILDGRNGSAFIQGGGYILKDNYNVLEPLESEEVTVDTSQASPQVIEMFTALSQKVVALEKALASVEFQLRSTQRNVETFAEQTESNSEDIRTLDERTQVINAITKFYGGERR